MNSWLKSRKKTTPKNVESNQLIKSNGCLRNFNFCFNQTNMIDCEAISDDSEEQTNPNTKTTDDEKKINEAKSKKKSKSLSSDMSKKGITYSIKCINDLATFLILNL